jgi:hypothetical protein
LINKQKPEKGTPTLEQMIVNTPSESTIRRHALREGFRVVKSRKASGEYDNLGEYMLIETFAGHPALGHDYDATLTEIVEFLTDARLDV